MLSSAMCRVGDHYYRYDSGSGCWIDCILIDKGRLPINIKSFDGNELKEKMGKIITFKNTSMAFDTEEALFRPIDQGDYIFKKRDHCYIQTPSTEKISIFLKSAVKVPGVFLRLFKAIIYPAKADKRIFIFDKSALGLCRLFTEIFKHHNSGLQIEDGKVVIERPAIFHSLFELVSLNDSFPVELEQYYAETKTIQVIYMHKDLDESNYYHLIQGLSGELLYDDGMMSALLSFLLNSLEAKKK